MGVQERVKPPVPFRLLQVRQHYVGRLPVVQQALDVLRQGRARPRKPFHREEHLERHPPVYVETPPPFLRRGDLRVRRQHLGGKYFVTTWMVVVARVQRPKSPLPKLPPQLEQIFRMDHLVQQLAHR